MSGGPRSVCFHSQSESRESRMGGNVPRDRSGRQVSAPFWTVPNSPPTNQPNEVESMYARSSYAGGRSMQHHHVSAGIASPPSVIEPPQRTEMWSTSVHLHAAAAVAVDLFPGPTGHAPRSIHFPEAVVRQLDCSRPGLGPFRVGPDLRGNPQTLANANAPSHDIAEASALGFTQANQPWEETLGTAFTSRVHASLPPHVRSWQSSEPRLVQLPSLISNDTTSIEAAHPQNANDDVSDDVYTFLCEWTDEHGTCNMTILGDRIWMSHHLSRHHNVVGHEKSQRACLWRGCTDTMNKGSLARHVVSRHLRAGASCGFCSKVYSRADVARRHTKKCKVANGALVQRDQIKW